jgi:hypothetical protein
VRFTSRRAAPSSRRITQLAARAAHQLPLVRLLVVQSFAVIGLVIGPLVFSLLMSIIDIYKHT